VTEPQASVAVAAILERLDVDEVAGKAAITGAVISCTLIVKL
jgi:hypothetical protein